ncbi:hypothetical protein ANO14919_137600 [Xylariales sp. No.14919]|nr:hypothetical protein ANO14919_137600 [Xylariales sp. No.14919]
MTRRSEHMRVEQHLFFLLKDGKFQEHQQFLIQIAHTFNKRPALKVLENELDLKLETYVSQLELSLLHPLEKAIFKTRIFEWTDIASAIGILLAVIERDI